MMRDCLSEIQSNQQFDDSLENIESNKENSSTTNTTFTKDDAKPSFFYEIPNTPVSLKRRLNQNSKIRQEIRKSLNNTVTLRKTIEQKRELLKAKRRDSNATYIKDEKKVKSKEKICDVIYLKTIDNLLTTVTAELELGRINSKFTDDRKYTEIFLGNVNKLTSHLHAKLKFNAGLKILRWWRNQLAIRDAKQTINELKARRNAAIIIQKNWRRRQAQLKYAKLIKENSIKRRTKMIENSKTHLDQLHKSIQQAIAREKEKKRIELFRHQNAKIIQKCWRNYQFKKTLNDLIKKRYDEKVLKRNESALLIQKNWRNYQFRKTINKKIEEHKLQKAIYDLWLKNQSALIIQRNWKIYLMKTNLRKLAERRRYELAIVQNESAKLIQRNFKIYLFRKNTERLIEQKRKQRWELECRSVSIIQKNWKIYQLKRNLIKRVLERRKLKVNACIKIQRMWKKYQAYKLRRMELEEKSAKIIQSAWRLYRARIQLEKEYHQRNQAASIIQRNWRFYASRRRMKLNRVRKNNHAALVIQKAWRSYLRRKIQFEEQRRNEAAIQIQKVWRGYMTRLKSKRDDKRVSGIFERISEVNKNAITQETIGEKTKTAIQKLLNYKYHGTALHLLQELEKTTNLSDESCIQLANVTIIKILFKVISECNRSEPCLQIIKLVYSVILNIAKNDKALPILSSIPSLKDSIIDTLNKHHKQTGIFLKAMTLLYILLKYENFPNSPAMSTKIRRLLNRISESNQFSAMKQQKDKIYQFDARWKAKRSIRAQFNTTKQAIEAFDQIYG